MSKWKFGTVIRDRSTTVMIIGRNLGDAIDTDDGQRCPTGDHLGVTFETTWEDDWPIGKSCWVSTNDEDFLVGHVDWRVLGE